MSETNSMSKFKVGDKVVILTDYPPFHYSGKTATVTSIIKDGYDQVMIKEDVNPYNNDFWNIKITEIRKLTKLDKALK